jgi:replicative DNA helicase
MNNDAYRQVSAILKAEDFREDFHRRVWKTIDHMVGGMGKIASPLTIKTAIGDVDIGGVTTGQYLARLAAEAATLSSVKDYAEIIRDLAARRRLIGVCQDTIDEAYDMPVESKVAMLIDNFEDNVMALRAHTGDASDFENFEDVSLRALEEANEAYTRGPGLVGLSSGFQRIDDALGGLMKTNLIILGGRPGAGKTALSTNIGLSVARDLQRRKKEGEKVGRVGFFSLEMKKEQLVRRIFADVSGVPDWKVRRGFATEDEMTRWIDAQRELRTIPFDIDDTSGLTIGQLRIRARNLKKRRGLELLIVDYLQLLSGAKDSGRRETNRTQEITEITTGLKELAKELDIPIIALSQLSRRVEERDDKRPMLSDLRESGSIEQDADQVLFVYRDEYYISKQKAPMEGTEARAHYDRRMRAVKGIAEIIIGKNRHGPEATIELGFDGSLTKFLNSPEPREEEPEIEAQPRQKGPKLSKDALLLFGLLKSMSLNQYPVRIPTADEMRQDRNLKKTARLVSAIKARETFAQQVLGADTDAKTVEKRFRETMKDLRHAGIAMWSGNKDEPLVWIPELAE